MAIQKLTPFLWFDGQAEEAALFYTSIFKNSSMDQVVRYPEGTPLPSGTVMTASFTLEGMQFVGLNGGPHYQFTPAISFVISCADQQEVDYFWNKLLDGGKEDMCGWLCDRFGVSWQVIPDSLTKYIGGPDPAGSSRAVKAMLGMRKLIIGDLEKAYSGK